MNFLDCHTLCHFIDVLLRSLASCQQ
jgi:hypothetical protein